MAQPKSKECKPERVKLFVMFKSDAGVGEINDTNYGVLGTAIPWGMGMMARNQPSVWDW